MACQRCGKQIGSSYLTTLSISVEHDDSPQDWEAHFKMVACGDCAAKAAAVLCRFALDACFDSSLVPIKERP